MAEGNLINLSAFGEEILCEAMEFALGEVGLRAKYISVLVEFLIGLVGSSPFHPPYGINKNRIVIEDD